MMEERDFTDPRAVDRRSFIKRASITAAWGTPLILSLSAGTASAQGTSCIAQNGDCVMIGGMPCCPGLICQPVGQGFKCKPPQ